MVARPAQCQAGQGTRFNARFDQPLDRHLISATALETRDELNATGGTSAESTSPKWRSNPSTR